MVRDSVERKTTNVRESVNIRERNKQLFTEWYDHLNAMNLKHNTIAFRLYCIQKFLEVLDVDADKATQKDIERAVSKIRSSPLKESTRENIIQMMLAFYKYIFNLTRRDSYPDAVKHIKIKHIESSLTSKDILTKEEILGMINACKTLRDRALISLLWDGGMRIGELLNIKKEDIIWSNKDVSYATVTVIAKKTDTVRTVAIVFAEPFLREYLDEQKQLKDNQIIWVTRQSDHVMHYLPTVMLLRGIAKRAGITKRVNPHSFRHASATMYSEFLTEAQMKVRYGWTPYSKQPGTYTHLSDKSVNNAVARVYGKQVNSNENNNLESLVTLKTCPKCKTENIRIDFMFCPHCGTALNVEYVDRETERKKEMINLNEKVDKLSELLAENLEQEKRYDLLKEIDSINQIKYQEDQKELEEMDKRGELEPIKDWAKEWRRRARK